MIADPALPPEELAGLNALMDWYEKAGGGRFYRGLPMAHLYPLLRVLQRAVCELALSPAEFEAAAFEGRCLQNHLTGPLPTLRPHLDARWGARLAEVYPPLEVAEQGQGETH